MTTLFSATTIKNLKVKNRIIFPALVVCDIPVSDGIVTEKHLKHHEWLANSGVGMIVTGACSTSPTGKLNDNQLGVWSDDMIEGLSKISSICHKKEVPVLMQINHAGLRTVPSSTTDLVSSSDYEVSETTKARELSIEEIKVLQNEFVAAAIRAEKSGFDGIELHCAHKYLIDQFFSSVINKREDQYGGSPQNRARFATEILEEIKKHVSDDFILSCRMGCNTPTVEDAVEIAKELERAGADFLDISFSTILTPEVVKGNGPKAPQDFKYGGITYGAYQIKKNVSVPVSSVWRIGQKDAKEIIEEGYTDFVDICRGLLVEPDWVSKAMNCEETNKCANCRPLCHWFIDREKCPVWNKIDESIRLSK